MLLVFFTVSCSMKKDLFFMYSPNKIMCITVLNAKEKRYFVSGKHKNIPEKGFVKVDTRQINDTGDAIGVCWNESNLSWRLVNPNSRILINTLDTCQFKFFENWSTDSLGIPTAIDYHKENCTTLDLGSMRMFRNEGAIIEFK